MNDFAVLGSEDESFLILPPEAMAKFDTKPILRIPVRHLIGTAAIHSLVKHEDVLCSRFGFTRYPF